MARMAASRTKRKQAAAEPLEAFGRYAGSATLILSSLADGAKHGYALTKDIEAFAGVRIAPGTLYEALSRLESQGLIEALERAAQGGGTGAERCLADGADAGQPDDHGLLARSLRRIRDRDVVPSHDRLAVGATQGKRGDARDDRHVGRRAAGCHDRTTGSHPDRARSCSLYRGPAGAGASAARV